MRNKVIKTIEKYNMLSRGDSVIIALSGGADSVSLFNVILSIKDLYELKIYAAHVNHNLRGEESLRDENFVRNLCDKNGVELFVKSADVSKLSKAQKISEELCGRNIRYDFFTELAEKLGAKILTAHTANDNCETLLYNIARGTSLKGLCGIPVMRGNICRPLIEITTDEIKTYCKENKLDFVTDSTNLLDEYTRNKIRHNALPVLEQINPSFVECSTRFFRQMNEVNEYVTKIAYENLLKCTCKDGYSCVMLKGLPNVILSQAVALALSMNNAEAESRHIDLCIDIIKNGGAVCLKNGKKAVSSQGIFRITDDNDDNEEFEPVAFNSDLEISFNNKKYLFKKISAENADVSKNNLSFFDCYGATDKIVIRTRQQGDFFTLPDRKVTKSLKKLFIEMKIPREKRNKLLLAANGSEVLWIEGIGACHKCKATKNSSELVAVSIM